MAQEDAQNASNMAQYGPICVHVRRRSLQEGPRRLNYPRATLPRSWSPEEINISSNGKRHPPPSPHRCSCSSS
eukprot:3798592-Pyramimonas_sp.AAC.1